MRSFVLLACLFSVAFGEFLRSPRADKDIVQLAESDKDLSTLVTALKAGRLTRPLESKGPFTVFAPSNEAFAKMPKDDLQKLLDPRNIIVLDRILGYHVVYGAAVHSKDLKPDQKFKTTEGEMLEVQVRADGVHVLDSFKKDCKVTSADNEASNGVVHVIDHVLLPSQQTKDIITLAQGNKDLSTFVAAVTAGKLVTTLQGEGPFTVFAPSNTAFAHLPPATLKYLLEPEHIKELDAILEYHVVEGSAIYSTDLRIDQEFKTVAGKELEVSDYHSRIIVNRQAHVTSRDNGATNGVIHVIDRVLLPRNQEPVVAVQM